MDKRPDKQHVSKYVDIEAKRFFFDIKENPKGKYLRITEISGGRSCIVIPLDGVKEFKDKLEEIIGEAHQLFNQ